jgi:DNA-binding MarR family transcriptional regulator
VGKSHAKSYSRFKAAGLKPEASNRSIDADIREVTSLLYAAMGRFQQVRRTFASALALTPAEFAIVMSLHRLNRARVRELSEDIHVAAANVTASLKALENKGWIVKRPDPRDVRALSIELTDVSRRRLDKFFLAIHPVNEIWFRGTGASDHVIVKRFLTQLIEQFPPALREARSLRSRLSPRREAAQR